MSLREPSRKCGQSLYGDNLWSSSDGVYWLKRQKNGLSLGIGGKEAWFFPRGFAFARKVEIDPKMRNGSVRLKRKLISEAGSDDDLSFCGCETEMRIMGRFNGAQIWTLTFQCRKDGLWFCLSAPGFDEVGLAFASGSNEAFMGFGEQFSYLDLAGKKFTLCTSEKGIGRGKQPLSALVNLASRGSAGNKYATYAPLPVCVTSDNRAFCFEQETVYFCDIRKSRRNQAVFSVWGDCLSGYFFTGASPLSLIEKHTAVTGRLKPLPAFAYGTIIGLRGGLSVAESVLEKLKKLGVSVSALWIEDWQGRRGENGGPPLWWRWRPDESLYPDFKNWAKELKESGIALLGYVNPFLSVDKCDPLYVHGANNRYFVKRKNGEDYISHFYTSKEYEYVYVDLTNPDAYEWLKESLQTAIAENGLSGWMADYGEHSPMDGVYRSADVVKAHCSMPGIWSRLNYELEDCGGRRDELLIFHRSASASSNHYSRLYWAGDQTPTLDDCDGLASAVTALITGGISGMSVNHTDIGGFTSIMHPMYKLARSKEVMFRWMEVAAFTPIFRTHEGNFSNSLNYQFYSDDDGFEQLAKMSKLHDALGWYFKILENEAVEKGFPMIRALHLHYPLDKKCKSIKTQFLLGSDLLVNPVYRVKANYVDAWLPNDKWVSPYTGAVYTGGAARLSAPVGKPAVLIRSRGASAESLIKALGNLSV
jgi:alpha-glucosidase